jgi:hypothetical protein
MTGVDMRDIEEGFCPSSNFYPLPLDGKRIQVIG